MNAITSRSAWIGKILSFPPVPWPMTSGSESCRASCTRIAIGCRSSAGERSTAVEVTPSWGVNFSVTVISVRLPRPYVTTATDAMMMAANALFLFMHRLYIEKRRQAVLDEHPRIGVDDQPARVDDDGVGCGQQFLARNRNVDAARSDVAQNLGEKRHRAVDVILIGDDRRESEQCGAFFFVRELPKQRDDLRFELLVAGHFSADVNRLRARTDCWQQQFRRSRQ